MWNLKYDTNELIFRYRPTDVENRFMSTKRKREGGKVRSSVQSLSRVRLFVTPWIAAHQASLSITNCWSLLKLMSIESVMPSNHLILCCPLLLLPSIFPSIRVFSNESVLHNMWPKYWSFSFNISPSNEELGISRYNLLYMKEISPGCSLEGLMLKLKLQYFAYLMRRTDSFEKTLMLGTIEEIGRAHV